MQKKITTLQLLVLLALNSWCYANELKSITSEQFISQNSSPERRQIVQFISDQFKGADRTKLDKKTLDEIWANKKLRNSLNLARIQIINQKLYADSFDFNNHRFQALIRHIEKLTKLFELKNLDFLIILRDEILKQDSSEKEFKNLLAFMMSKDLESDEEKNMLLFPNDNLMNEDWKSLSSQILHANLKTDWNEKISKVFWRGATTEPVKIYNLENFDKLPRLTLVIKSALYPDLIDAKFSYYPQFSNDDSGNNLKTVLEILKRRDSNRVNEIEHLKFKYLISIDGNSSTWVRPIWIMLSNSVLVKQETNKIEWYHSALKPYFHYVPVNENLNNLFSQIQWMKSHDAELQIISQNAQSFVINNLMPKDIDIQSALILNEYSKLQDNLKLHPSLPDITELEKRERINNAEKLKQNNLFGKLLNKLKNIFV